MTTRTGNDENEHLTPAGVSALADRCRTLPDWPNLSVPDGYPDSLALCIIDAIWSMGIRYVVVENVLNHYRSWLHEHDRGSPDRRTSTDLVEDIRRAGGSDAFAAAMNNRNLTSSRNGILKAEAVLGAATALKKLEIFTTADIRARHDDHEAKSAWTNVHGQRSGISWHYLLILAGVNDVKADRMICRFVAESISRDMVSPAVARSGLIAAYQNLVSDAPDLSLRALDNAVWNFQRARARTRR